MTQNEIDEVLPLLYDSCTFKQLGKRFLISHYSRNNGSRIIIGRSEKATLRTLKEVYKNEENLDSVKINFAQAVDFVSYPKTQFLTIARTEYRHYKRAWANSIKSQVMEIYKETGSLLPNFLLCPENKVADSDLYDEEELKEYICESHSYCVNCNSGYGILLDSKFDEDKLYLSTLKPNIAQSFSEDPPTHTIEKGYYGLDIYEYEQKEELAPTEMSVYIFPYASFTLRGHDFKGSAELVITELKALKEVWNLEHKQFKAQKQIERKSKEREVFFAQLKLLNLA